MISPLPPSGIGGHSLLWALGKEVGKEMAGQAHQWIWEENQLTWKGNQLIRTENELIWKGNQLIRKGN